mmetsp:Transcript_21309/g.52153  ORF Transcript_21309/g.52153 Transcript_21309/m.52153 type:complete len:224 (-) Transcript_21309:77-748(-)
MMLNLLREAFSCEISSPVDIDSFEGDFSARPLWRRVCKGLGGCGGRQETCLHAIDFDFSNILRVLVAGAHNQSLRGSAKCMHSEAKLSVEPRRELLLRFSNVLYQAHHFFLPHSTAVIANNYSIGALFSCCLSVVHEVNQKLQWFQISAMFPKLVFSVVDCIVDILHEDPGEVRVTVGDVVEQKGRVRNLEPDRGPRCFPAEGTRLLQTHSPCPNAPPDSHTL